jgi:hypothetical protein
MKGRRWLHPVSNPAAQLSDATLRQYEEMNYICGHSHEPIEEGLESTVENFRVHKTTFSEWNFDKRSRAELPCSLLYWLRSNALTPTKLLKYVWGDQATLSGYNPRVIIGELDKGCLEEYIHRCVVESCAERYCQSCSFNQTRIRFGALELLDKLADSTFLETMSDVIQEKYAGIPRSDPKYVCVRQPLP